MTAVREKAQGYTRQIIGEMIGDELLVREGKEQQQHSEEQSEAPSSAYPEQDSSRRSLRLTLFWNRILELGGGIFQLPGPRELDGCAKRATNYQPYRSIRRDMGTPKRNDRKTTKSAEPCSDHLLEVWLGLLKKIEGPRRRRAEGVRRRCDNPKRRASRTA
jgi:hypothetical protein